MALTVVSKPSGFQPVGGGKLIYKFTEASLAGKVNYRVLISLNGFGSIPTFEFRPDASLTINADIAPQLRAALALSETPANRFKNTYVTYQAVWDASSDAAVNLSSDVIYFYIGNNTILNKRTTFQITSSTVAPAPFLFPTASDNIGNPKLYAWLGRTAYVDFLHDNSLSVDSWLELNGFNQNETNQSGGQQAPVCGRFAGNVNNLESLNFKAYYNTNGGAIKAGVTKTVINDSDFANVYKIYVGSADISNGIAQTFTAPATLSGMILMIRMFKVGNPTNSLTFKILGTSAGLPNEADVRQTRTYDPRPLSPIGGSMNYIQIPLPLLTSGNVYAVQVIPNADGTNDASNYYAMYASTTNVYASGNLSLKGGSWVNDANKDFAMLLFQSTTQYALFAIEQKIESQNPVYIKFLNQLGGISTWLFDYNQLLSLQPNEIGRFKKIQLTGYCPRPDVWYLINELNMDGVEYGDNFQSGIYAYDFTDETNPIQVLPMAQVLNLQTKANAPVVQLTLRYPLIPNIAI